MHATVASNYAHRPELLPNKYSTHLILLLILNSHNSQLHLANYKFNSPDPLDNKALLIATDFTIGNIAAHLLPPENIMSGMVTAADYMRGQNIAAPNDLLQQCGAVALTNSLPAALLNHAVMQSNQTVWHML